ncbi:MAG: PQQ-binding-like beta-propeller repeat protein [Thermoplasmatota archaeon]
MMRGTGFLAIVILLVPTALIIDVPEGSAGGYQNGDYAKMDSWPMYGGDPSHSRRIPYNLRDDLLLHRVWSTRITENFFGYITMSESKILYASTHEGDLVAVNELGSILWRYDGSGQSYDCCPAVGPDGTIYYTTDDYHIHAVYPNGTQRWKINTGAGVVTSSPPIVSENGTVYVGTGRNGLYAIDPNGSILWIADIEENLYYAPAMDNDGNIYVNSAGGEVFKVYPNGSVDWSVYLGAYAHCCLALTDNYEVIIGNDEGSLFCIRNDGTVRWEIDINGRMTESASIGYDGRIFVATESGVLISLDETGEILWNISFDRLIGEPVVDIDGSVYICADSFYKISQNGTMIFELDIGSWFCPVIASTDTVYCIDYRSAISRFNMTRSYPPSVNRSVEHADMITIFWDPPAGNTPDEITGYRLIRTNDYHSNPVIVGETVHTNLNDTPPRSPEAYHYQVVTLSIYGESEPSPPFRVYYTGQRSAPDIFWIRLYTRNVDNGIQLIMSSERMDEILRIDIFRSEDDDGNFRYLDSVYYPYFDYVDTDVREGTLYLYHCIGYDGSNKNSESDIDGNTYSAPDPDPDPDVGLFLALLMIVMIFTAVFGAVVYLVLRRLK